MQDNRYHRIADNGVYSWKGRWYHRDGQIRFDGPECIHVSGNEIYYSFGEPYCYKDQGAWPIVQIEADGEVFIKTQNHNLKTQGWAWVRQ